MQEFNEWLEGFVSQGFDGSDLHLTEGRMPLIRARNMGITPVEDAPKPNRESLRSLYQNLANKNDLERDLNEGHGADFAVTVGDRRMRVNLSYQGGGKEMSAALRVLNDTVPPLHVLGLPTEHIKRFISSPSGLILVTGITGSGKSTSLASMLMERAKRPEQIRTLEDPIEYPLTDISRKKNLPADVHQAEVGVDTASFNDGLRSALRQDPDVILVGEIRDGETAEEAMRAAQTGHLVLSTLHTRSAHMSIKRMMGMFSEENKGAMCESLADNLIAIISQVLVPSADGEGRVLAYEIMTTDNGIDAHIREGKDNQIKSEMSAGGDKFGMTTLNATLMRLIQDDVITRETALEKTYDRKRLEEGKP